VTGAAAGDAPPPDADAPEALPARGNGGMLTPRKIAVQLVGFAIGVALLGWCVSTAVRGEGWSRLADASPMLVVGLVGCSAVSMLVNGAIFWLVVRPLKPLGFWSMQWLNLTTGVLNYAPIRLGVIARVAYHLRVDRLSLLQVGAMLASIAYTLAAALGACVVATLLRPEFDLVWPALVVGQLLLIGVLTRAIMGQPFVVRFGRGMDRMLREPALLWGAIALRLVDIAAFAGRMACAVAILDISMTVSETLLLGFAALALSLNPIGRTGFREFMVAVVATRLVSSDLSAAQIDSNMATLALIESAGEALVVIPCGALALLWYRRRWRAAGARSPEPDAG
jgi:hypothetical protein